MGHMSVIIQGTLLKQNHTKMSCFLHQGNDLFQAVRVTSKESEEKEIPVLIVY